MNKPARPAMADRSRRVAIISFLIVMVDGYDTLMVAFIAPLLSATWHLTPVDIGKLFAIGYLGAFFGAIGMGTLADAWGRKPTLIAALTLTSVATFLCGFATSLPMLMALRFVAGIALGGALPAAIALTAEHAAPARRHGTVTLMYMGFPAGAVVGGALTAAVLHNGWQNVFWGAGAACLAATGLALLLPEKHTNERAPGRVSFLEQFADGRLWPALFLWLGLFSMLVLTYFLVSFSPTLIKDLGGSAKIAALSGVILNIGGIVGAVGTAPLINRFGPYYPVAFMLAVGAALVAAFGQSSSSLPVTFMLLFLIGVCIIGGQLNFPAMTVALFPAHVRGTGAGWTAGVGRLGSIVGPLAGGTLIASAIGYSALFAIASCAALITTCALVAAARLNPHRPLRD